jgi:hypothetical protein
MLQKAGILHRLILNRVSLRLFFIPATMTGTLIFFVKTSEFLDKPLSAGLQFDCWK